MCSVQALREFINGRLTAAAGEIFTVFEQTIVQYEEEIDRQRRLLDISWKPPRKFHTAELPQQHVCKEEQLCDQETPDPPQIKEEEEELCTSRAREQLVVVTVPDGESDRSEKLLPHSSVKEFINGRLTAAAGEIFTKFEETVVQYEEIDRQRRLLDISWKPDLTPHRTELPQQHVCKEEQLCDQERNSDLDQEEPEPPKIKEDPEEPQTSQFKKDPEEVRTSQEGDQLVLMRETDTFTEPLTGEDGDHSEPEPDHEEPLSHTSAAAESRDQKQGQHADSGSTRNVELKPNKRRHKNKCHNDDEDNPLMPAHRCETRTSVMPYSCEKCGKSFSEKNTLILRITHTAEKPFSCETCGKRFSRQSNLLAHLRVHSDEKLRSCQTCGKSFSQQRTLLIHMRTHTGEKPYSCETCGNSFSQQSTLLIHMRTHTGEKPYSCERCGKSFSQQSNLLVHMRTHTGEKPFPCETCGKSFPQMSNLSRHMRTHTGEKLCSCKTCGKRFSQRSHLLTHRRTHTGEKLYSCETCGENFRDQSNLLTHRKTHSGEKPHSCETCGKSFSQQSHLLFHMRTHTGEKPYPCETCGKSFKYKGTLFVHMRVHNGEKP